MADMLTEIERITGYHIDGKVLKSLKSNADSLRLLMTQYRCAIMEIETKFKVLNEQFSLTNERNPIETIKTRLKSPESIVEKLNRRGLELSVESIEENLNDVAGIRVICPFVDDIYTLCDCLLSQDDIRLIRKKDYIKTPKQNGYRSLHLIVEVPIFLASEKKHMKVEVQLRTIAMDFWASLEHRLRYKKNLPHELAEQLAFELSQCAQISSTLDYRMGVVKNKIFQMTDDNFQMTVDK